MVTDKDFYAEWFHNLHIDVDRHDPKMLKLIKENFKGRVLDVGCGEGYYIGILKSFLLDAIGVDASPGLVRLANKKGHKTYVGLAEKLEFGDNSFDGVLMVDVIEHVKEHDACLEHIARILKPEGTLVLTTPNYPAKLLYSSFDDPTHINKYNYFKLKKHINKYFNDVKIDVNWCLLPKVLWNKATLMLLGHKFYVVAKFPQ